MPTLRPCLDCGRLHNNPTRCSNCTAVREQTRWRTRPLPYKERARRKRAVDAWVDERGLLCNGLPMFDIPPHQVADRADLTADHIVPVALGGGEDGELIIRCRRCNSIKSARRAG